MNRNPKVSVIMPVYNAEKYIEEAMKSILNQTEQDLELILIDDCGNDSSMEKVQGIRDTRICIIHNQHNKGISYSRNQGIEHARGKYIALMDDDDVAPLDRLEVESRFLDDHADIDVVGGGALWINEEGEVTSYLREIICNPRRIRAELIFRDVIENGSAMMRAEFINRNHLRYRDGYLGMEDFKFWTECSVFGNIANISKVLLYWRENYHSETFRVGREQAESRREKFAEIQRETLRMNGFCLDAEELRMFTDFFPENKGEYIRNAELEKVCGLLKKMIIQAENSHMENVSEFKSVCHKMYALKTENSELWKDN